MGRKKREYTYEEYIMAMILHKYFKLGCRRISRVLGISESTVEKWLYCGIVPPAAKWIAKPCIELGYAIGTVQGDGSVCIRKDKYRYLIELATIDPRFAETFSRVMSRLLDVKYHKPYWNERKKQWLVEYYSKAFVEWYKRVEGEGLEGFKPYIEYSRETIKYYLRGLFDSEGYNKRNKQIQLGNTNEELLKYVQYLLKKYFDIVATGPYLQKKAGTIMIINGIETTLNQDYYRIFISRKEHVQKFLKEIGFSIVRKQRGLKKNEKVLVEGIGYVEPYELIKLGMFKLPFSD